MITFGAIYLLITTFWFLVYIDYLPYLPAHILSKVHYLVIIPSILATKKKFFLPSNYIYIATDQYEETRVKCRCGGNYFTVEYKRTHESLFKTVVVLTPSRQIAQN